MRNRVDTRRVARGAAIAALGLSGIATLVLGGLVATVVNVVAAENFYGNVIEQIGGMHVHVTSIISNPNTDPHSYESSTTDASAMAGAQIVVRNGLGYDSFIDKLANASPSSGRVLIDVGQVFGRKTGDNPHQWYDPATMPRVAALVATHLSRLDPIDKGTFQANLRAFDASMSVYTSRIAALRKRFAGTPIAVTEPVFGYAAAAVGLTVLTPRSFQLAIQEGNDPSPQDVQTEENLFTSNRVKMFAYNQQAVAPITTKLLPLARAHHIPVIGVYETMPLSRTYQGWMAAEMDAVDRALSHGVSTETIK